MMDYHTPIHQTTSHFSHSAFVRMPERLLQSKTSDVEVGTPWRPVALVMEGRMGRYISVALSPNGLRIVSSSGGENVRVWDAVSGVLQHTLIGHTAGISSASFSPDGLLIMSCSDDGTVRVWDAVSGVLQHTLTGHTSRVNSAAFSSDGLRIVSSSDDTTVRVWDAVSGVVQHTLIGHTRGVASAAFLSDGLRIVSSSWDQTVRIWDAISGTLRRTLEGFKCGVDDVPQFLAHSPLGHGMCHFFLITRLFCSRRNISLLLIDVVLVNQDSQDYFKLGNEGWLFRRDSHGIWRRICWLPYKRRDKCKIGNSGQRVCISTSSGVVTILDYSDVNLPRVSSVHVA
jgi:WD40 repeat protein